MHLPPTAAKVAVRPGPHTLIGPNGMTQIRVQSVRAAGGSLVAGTSLDQVTKTQHPGRSCEPVDVTAVVTGCAERVRIADPVRTWRVRVDRRLRIRLTLPAGPPPDPGRATREQLAVTAG